MKLKDYIREGYNIVTTPNLAYKIQEDYPDTLVFTDRALDAIPIGKLLVDRYYRNNPAVLSVKPLQNAYAIESFSWIWVNTSDTICENFFEIPAGEYLIVSTSRQTKTVWPLIEAMKLKPCGNLAKKM